MTFVRKIQLFFLPLRANKILVVLSCIKFISWWAYAIASVIIIKSSIHAIELWQPILYKHYISLFIIFFIGYFLFSWIFRTTDWPRLYHSLEKWIYRRYIPHIVSLDNNYLESIGTGRMISIVTQGTKTWIELLSNLLKEWMKISITWWFLLYLIAQVNIQYGFILVISLVMMQGIIVWIDTIAHRYRRVRTDEKNELTRKIIRVIMSKHDVLQNNTLQRELSWIENTVDHIAEANNNINKSLFFIFNLVRLFAVGIRFFVLFFIGYWVFTQNFSITEFVTTMSMVIVFESFLFDSTEFYKNFTKDFADIEKIWTTLDEAPMIRWYDSWLKFFPQLQNIEIKNISYGYNDTKVFEDFSLTIKRWQKTALVWASGGGKTTLMKLIAGYLHPESGYISIMGNQLDETALKSYYPHIGYLTQDPWVFDATIRENLVSSITRENIQTHTEDTMDKDNIISENNKKDTTVSSVTACVSQDEMLEKALKLAQCDFVFEMEKGLDTEIGERWVRLSWWQKQRLAIAKIFLKDPEIILLDEPTSALDSFSEEKITEALDILFQDRTVIIVAHRLQTVKRADDIIVIEAGEVVERGDHHELVANKGIYHKMLELQSWF